MCMCIQDVLLTVYIQRLDIAVYRSEKDVRHLSYVYMDFDRWYSMHYHTFKAKYVHVILNFRFT